MEQALAINEELSHNVALLVGGSSGIGFNAAMLLSQRGAQVCILADRGVDEAQQLAAQAGVTLHGFTGDAAQSAVVKAVVDQVVQQFGGLHITVHTAAILTGMQATPRKRPGTGSWRST
jgi:NAD(P)-dependent dehydrogenase (short-subunit alcohol dehydrogenase family)